MDDAKPERTRAIPSRIGGHPALDFVNTWPMGRDGRRETLPAYADLVRWARGVDLVSEADAADLGRGADGKDAVRAHRQALELREALREALVGQFEDAAGAPQALLDALNRALAKRRGVLRAGLDGVAFTGPLQKPDDLVALLAEQIADLVFSEQWPRVRPCEGHACVLWFVDATRNGSRRWCRTETCGARAKAASYYRRRKAKA